MLGRYDEIRQIDGKNLTVANSKSGSAMTFLQGIEVRVDGGWYNAHIALPPNKAGDGLVDEGHLKIEGGKFLNQYFFAVGEGEVTQIKNSPTVPTEKPGDWKTVGSDLWDDVENLMLHILF